MSDTTNHHITTTYAYCSVHPEVWISAAVSDGMSGGASQRECPECVHERTRERLKKSSGA